MVETLFVSSLVENILEVKPFVQISNKQKKQKSEKSFGIDVPY